MKVTMANTTGIKMTPVEGGDSVVIPHGKTTIGRGAFLQVPNTLFAEWLVC